MKTVYRIYTESSEEHDARTIALAAEHFEGFTITHGTGYWKGAAEDSIIIEIIADSDEASAVHALGERIRVANQQEAVLLTRHDVVSILANGE